LGSIGVIFFGLYTSNILVNQYIASLISVLYSLISVLYSLISVLYSLLVYCSWGNLPKNFLITLHYSPLLPEITPHPHYSPKLPRIPTGPREPPRTPNPPRDLGRGGVGYKHIGSGEGWGGDIILKYPLPTPPLPCRPLNKTTY